MNGVEILAGLIAAGVVVRGGDMSTLDAITEQYLATQLWAQLDMDRMDEQGNNPELDENYDTGDVSDEYRAALRDELAEVIATHPLAFRMWVRAFNGDAAQWAHDYYLTREGHGAGFWDRFYSGDWREHLGEYWTRIAKSVGSADMLYDDGTGKLIA